MKGFYCPLNTKYAQQYPCPAGTYNNIEGKSSVSDCLKIPAGYWNDGQGTVDFTVKKLV
jgi:hypothetical protein